MGILGSRPGVNAVEEAIKYLRAGQHAAEGSVEHGVTQAVKALLTHKAGVPGAMECSRFVPDAKFMEQHGLDPKHFEMLLGLDNGVISRGLAVERRCTFNAFSPKEVVLTIMPAHAAELKAGFEAPKKRSFLEVLGIGSKKKPPIPRVEDSDPFASPKPNRAMLRNYYEQGDENPGRWMR